MARKAIVIMSSDPALKEWDEARTKAIANYSVAFDAMTAEMIAHKKKFWTAVEARLKELGLIPDNYDAQSEDVCGLEAGDGVIYQLDKESCEGNYRFHSLLKKLAE